ncbi:MAG: YlxR family protein, partial [Mariprofundaceae bacterium]
MKSNSGATSDTAPGIAPESKRKLNQRQCLICRNRAEKSEMLRLVVDDEGQVWPDLQQKAPGRGTYLCMQKACLENLSDKRLGALRRDFNVQLPQSSKLIERMRGGLHQQLMRLFSQ